MLRSVLLAGCMLVGCASAGRDTGNGDNPDANPGQDAPLVQLDAAVLVDAPPVTTDAPPAASCTGTDTCQTATMLGTVSGDSGNMKLSAAGYQSAWYRVRVSEGNSDPFGLSLRFAAKVTSPANAMFDVYVYVN